MRLIDSLKDQLFQIVNTLIRVSAETRSMVLDWFAKIVNLNTKRTAMQVSTPPRVHVWIMGSEHPRSIRLPLRLTASC